MKLTIDKVLFLLASILYVLSLAFFIGCENKEKPETGVVSFGANTHILNCIVTAEVFVDDAFTGVIPGFSDTIPDCNSENTLTVELPAGEHSYRIEVKNPEGYCNNEKNGSFIIEADGCTLVFYDLNDSGSH